MMGMGQEQPSRRLLVAGGLLLLLLMLVATVQGWRLLLPPVRLFY